MLLSAILQRTNDLLAGDRLVVSLLDLIADECTTYRAEHHGDIAAGTATDQAADTETGQAADHGANAGLRVVLQLDRCDLLDDAAANFDFTGLAARRRAGSQGQGQRQGGYVG